MDKPKSRADAPANVRQMERCTRSLILALHDALVEGFHGTVTVAFNVKDGVVLSHDSTVHRRHLE